jgi:signal transduction histidine kinase
MRLPEFAQTTAFRWTLGIAAWFVAMSLLLFAFIYWQTIRYERNRMNLAIMYESAFIARSPPDAVNRLQIWLREDLHNVRFAGLFGRNGKRITGNLASIPSGLVANAVRPAHVQPIDHDHDWGNEIILAVKRRLADGRLLVVGNDTNQVERMREIIQRALELDLVPVLLLSLAGGTFMAVRAQRRVALVREAVGRIMSGQLHERLPVHGRTDEFDRLAISVNFMLAEMERLVRDIRGTGDSIAHDLRTPLTRLRSRLERSRDAVRTTAQFQEAIDQAIKWIDQALAIIIAVLRIGEIEYGRRRAAFARLDLADVLREVAELYDPIAEAKRVRLHIEIGPAAPVQGDRELMIEAIGNLVDNAIKYAPEDSVVSLVLKGEPSAPVIQVIDSGPGIPAEEHEAVLKRFYRSEKSRHLEGSGLGLSLVAAVAGLHDFHIRIGGADPGCVFEIQCAADPAPTEASRHVRHLH